MFVMALAGLIGGILAWAGGEALRFRPDPRIEAQQEMAAIGDLTQRANAGQMSPADVDRAVTELRREYADNPYFAVYSKHDFDRETERTPSWPTFSSKQGWKDFIASGLGFGLSGMLIAVCLAIAEPLVDRNSRQVMINGTIAASVGFSRRAWRQRWSSKSSTTRWPTASATAGSRCGNRSSPAA